MSRLLLENSNQEVVYQNPVSDDDPELQWNIHSSFIAWKTPQKGSDIRKYADIMEKVDETDIPTRRLLFRKIQKGFDAKDYELVQSKKRIKQLEQKLEEIIPKKRRMVKTSPNSRFAGIEAIYQAQIEAGDREIEIKDSDSIYETDTTGDCIEVE